MKIYMFKYSDVIKRFPEYNSFTASEWNELEKLPKKVIELITIAKRKDTVYTGYNFMLCFNLQDKETYHGDWVMFIPDPKFNVL
jgi:hypothetical protein